jgi:hypothetical protein
MTRPFIPALSRASGALAILLALPATPALMRAQTGGTVLTPTKNEDVSRVATRGANFLNIGVGARPLALSGAYTASASDLSAMYWNVAGLGDVTSPSGFASYEKMYGNSGVTNTFAGAALPAFGGVFGMSFTSFSSGDIDRTSEAWPEGGDPTFGTTVTWSATSIGLHYARPLTDRLVVGTTIKRADEGIEFAHATYYGADFGIRFRSGLAGSTLGVSVSNLGTSSSIDGPAVRRRVPRRVDPQFPTGRPIDVQLTTEQLQLPTMLRIGVQTDVIGTSEALRPGVGPHRLSIFTDVTDGIDTKIMPAVAAEYGFRDRVFFRGGMRYRNENRVTGGEMSATYGVGIKMPVAGRHFLLDYGYRRMGDLNDNQVVSFQFGY